MASITKRVRRDGGLSWGVRVQHEYLTPIELKLRYDSTQR